MKCKYHYKGNTYDNLADLYNMLLSEAEEKDSLLHNVNPNTNHIVTRTKEPVILSAFEKRVLAPKNVFIMQPVNTSDQYVYTLGSIANKFIGFGEGIENSDTEQYRKAAKENANVGEYSPADVVFVHVPDSSGDRETRLGQQALTIKEAIKAIDSGATLVTKPIEAIKLGGKLEGDKRLVEALQGKYNYISHIVNNKAVGIWYKDRNADRSKRFTIQTVPGGITATVKDGMFDKSIKVSKILVNPRSESIKLLVFKEKGKYSLFTPSGYRIDTPIKNVKFLTDYVNHTLDIDEMSREDIIKYGFNFTDKQLTVKSKIESLSGDVVLDTGLGKYVNIKTGKTYDRVSDVINNFQKAEGKYLSAASLLGTALDTIARDIMNDSLKSYEEYQTIKDTPAFTTRENFNKFVADIQTFKSKLQKRGEVIINNNGKEITLYNDEAGIAGTVDLLTVDADGNIHIYDYKTMRGNQFIDFYGNDTVNKYESDTYIEGGNKLKHTKQQSMYKALLEGMHPTVNVKSLNIVSIELNEYEPTDSQILYGNIFDVFSLSPIKIDLTKNRPEVAVMTPLEFFEHYEKNISSADKDTYITKAIELLNGLSKGETKEMVVKKGKVTITPLFDDEFTIVNEAEEEKSFANTEELSKPLARSLAYDDYLNRAVNEVEEGTVDKSNPITVVLPYTEEGKDEVFLKALPERSDSEAIITKHISYFDEYLTNNRLEPYDLPNFFNKLLTDTSKASHKAVLRLLIANSKVLENIPIIYNENLNRKGRLSIIDGKVAAIYFNPALMKNDADARTVILEEFVHAVAYNELRDPSNPDVIKRVKQLQEIAIEHFGKDRMAEMEKLENQLELLSAKQNQGSLTADEQQQYDALLNNDELNHIYYRLKNTDEFLAGTLLSNNFQRYINSIDMSTEKGEELKTLWDSIVDLILSVLKKFGYSNRKDTTLRNALYDALTVVENAQEKIKHNPQMLDIIGQYRNTVQELYTNFNLRNEEGHKNVITNAEEVAAYINENVYNVVAVANPDNTVDLRYIDSIGYNAPRTVKNLWWDDDNEDDDIWGDGDSVGARDKKARAEFITQVKSYISNLSQRRASLLKSLSRYEDTAELSPDEYKEYVIKQNEIQEELAKVGELLKNVTRKGVVQVNTLLGLKEQALGELENIKRFLNNNMNEADIKYALETTKFWLNARKLLFVEDNYNDTVLMELYADVENKAKAVDLDLMAKLDRWVLDKMVKPNTGYSQGLEYLLKNIKDIGKLSAEVSDLATVDNPIFQALAVYTREKDVELGVKRRKRLDQFEGVLKKAKNVLKSYATGKDYFEIFRQVDEFGNPTRNMVSRFSNKYNEERKVLSYFYSKAEKNRDKAYEAFKFLKSSTERYNLQALFPENPNDFDQDAYDKEEARLKERLGESHYAAWLATQAKKIKAYNKAKEGRMMFIVKKYGLNDESEIAEDANASIDLDLFLEGYSPYKLNDKLNNDEITANPFTLSYGYENFTFLNDIPKKDFKDEEGKPVSYGYYDSKFEIIERNEELSALYDEFQDILDYVSKLVPYGDAEHLAKGRIPEFKKSMYALFAGSMKNGLATMKESLIDALRTERFETESQDTDIITGKAKRRIKLGISKSDAAISRDIHMAKLEIYMKTGENPTAEEEAKIKSDIEAKYAKDMEFDLGKVFSMYLQLASAYEYKADIEDSMILSQLMFDNQQEYERNNKKTLIKDESVKGKLVYKQKDAKDSFTQQKRVLDHTIRSLVYGDKRDINSTKNKWYTSQEKAQKKYYESMLAQLEEKYKDDKANVIYETHKKKIENYIASLGAYGDTEKYTDIPIKWTQYKGMGWNWIGGISNMIFGGISNIIESAGEEHYTQSELMDAYMKVMHSVGRNLTFNNWTTDEALKIRSLMDTYDIMSESGKEYENLIGNDATSKLKWAAAFNANQRTEYINQAPLMIVMLQKTKFTHNGKEYPLYEGFDVDGKWDSDNYGEYPSKLVNNTIVKIKALVQRNHGNYNPLAPMLIKRTGIGRLLIQFRSWMVEGYRSRLGDRHGMDNKVLGSTYKGRYFSTYDAFKQEGTSLILPTLLQLLHNFIPFKRGFGINSNPLTKYFDGNTTVSAVDIANLKKTVMEVNLLIGAQVVMAILSSLVGDMDDDDLRKKALNLLINQSSRARTDILMYINPQEAMKIIQDPVPAIKSFTDAMMIIPALEKTIMEGSPEYESGIHKGRNRLLKTSLSAVPFSSVYYRSLSVTEQVFNK